MTHALQEDALVGIIELKIIDDIDLLYENVMDNDMSKDDIVNVLLGLKKIYSMRFEKSFDLFEKLCNEYHQLNRHEY